MTFTKSETNYKVWVERGGFPAMPYCPAMPFEDAVVQAEREQARHDKFARPESAKARFFVVETTHTHREVTGRKDT